jgi:SAM-dependent methyltransferase
MKSNLHNWQRLQERDYFGGHPCYHRADGSLNTDADDDRTLSRYLKLEDKRRVAVIGCGFGREVAVIAPKVGHVWGIDVTPGILDKAQAFLAERGVANFTPVLAERWKEDLPADLDLVYSVIVFQHLTRDLVRDYILNLPGKLGPTGEVVCQFADLVYGTPDVDRDEPHEPSVRWGQADIEALVAASGLALYRLDRQEIPEHGDWWWAHFGVCGK